MHTIFVQVKCDMGRAYEVARDIVDLDGVSEVYSISGDYDLIVKCHLPVEVDVGHFVTEKMQTIGGVKDTFTLITFNAFN